MERFTEKLDIKSRTAHLKNLVAMARVDGHLDNSELLFLYKVGKRFKLNPQDIADILTSTEETISIVPNDFSNNLLQLFDLVGMMMADGMIKEKELEFCNKMVDKFGFRKELVSEMIEQSKKPTPSQDDWSAFLKKAAKFQK